MRRGEFVSGGFVIFFVSAAVLLLQLSLMRSLSVARYHHFSYLVISTALLGFGASGTLLSLFYDRIRRRFVFWAHTLLLLFTFSIPLGYCAARLLPIDIRYLFYSADQLFLLLLYNLLIFIPFFFGAAVIALFLTYYSARIPVLYGINLFASGLGGIGALGLMTLLPAQRLPLTVGVAALAALVSRAVFSLAVELRPAAEMRGSRLGLYAALFAALGVTAAALIIPVPGDIDRYKPLAYLRQLEKQGDAEHVLTRHTARMRLDIYEAPSLHHTLFASPTTGEMPPAQMALLSDGETMGTVFATDSVEETQIMRHTPQSLAYRLLQTEHGGSAVQGERRESPQVLLLGETGGSNIWLAKNFGVDRITVVQENGVLLELLQGRLKEKSGGIFGSSKVAIAEKTPRLFLEQSSDGYELIQLTSAEGMPAAGGGLNSLHENHLLTVESIARAYTLLDEGGYLAATRGLQTPPRDNIKLFALFTEALRRAGVEEPSRHLLQARNYLAATTLISKSPVSESVVSGFRNACEELQMDVEYFPGIGTEVREQKNRIQGPEGKEYSYYHHAARKILSPDREESREFFRNWAYRVRPPTDDSPYFHNFFKWSSLEKFVNAYGGNFFRRMELGYLILVITLLEVSLAGFVLILLPLFFKRRGIKNGGKEDYGDGARKESKKRLPIFLHFAAIGFGFMFIEMVFIQKLSMFLGDPIYSASAVITAILVFAGIGSSLQKRIPLGPEKRIRIAGLAVVLYIVAAVWGLDIVLSRWIDFGMVTRYLISLLVLLPGSFFMGWLLPSGMERIENDTTGLIPWAWGVNGFTSVAASPLAVLLSTSIGFSGVLLAAAACYAAVAAASLQKISP